MVYFHKKRFLIEGATMQENEPFLHCLRTQIYPDDYAFERIASIRDFCVSFGFQNVILIFNGEEHNVGHIKDEELASWIKVMKEAKEEFAKANISVSLNPWMEMGHLDRGRKLQEGQHFVTMVDRFGTQSDLVACPLSEEWREYYLHQLDYYVREIKPDVLWVEDDFRFHNHPPLDWGGCFCSLHMEEFAKRLGKRETREEFVSNLSKGKPSEERKAWLDASWEIIDSLAKDIGETVKKANANTHVGLMSSTPWHHAMEARDWKTLHEDLSSDGVMIDRIHMPAYRELGAKSYYFDFNRVSMVNRSFIGDDCLIFPELENSSFSLFVKDRKFLGFQLESALPLGLCGMTYNIFAHVGNGIQEEFGYGKVIQSLSPYLNEVKKLHLLPSQMKGLLFPLDEKTVYNSHEEGFLNLVPKDFDAVGYFSSMGFSYCVSKKKRFQNEVVILSEQNAWNFKDEELLSLFEDNFVFVDGVAASILQDRGLLGLIHAKKVSFRGQGHGYDTLEMYEGEEPIDGMHHCKATSQRRNGDYYSIEYEKGVDVVSGLYGPRMNKTGEGVAIGSHFMVYPYSLEGTDNTTFFMPMRRFLFEKHLLPKIKKPFAKTKEDGVYAFLYEQGDRFVLFVTNANYCGYENLSFELYNFIPRSIKALLKTGEMTNVAFEKIGNRYVLPLPLEYLSTATILLEK